MLPSEGSQTLCSACPTVRGRSGGVAAYGTRAPAVLARLGFQVGMEAPAIGALTIEHCGRARSQD